MKFRFFGYLALSLKLIESQSAGGMGTACVDGKGNLYYNPEFINKLSVVEVMFVLCHEIMHIVQGVHSRFPMGGNHQLWNLAADFVVNAMIKDSEGMMNQPSNILSQTPIFQQILPEPYYLLAKGKTTEQVYSLLLQELKQQAAAGGGEGKAKGGQGKGKNQGGYGSPQGKGQGDNGPNPQDCDPRNKLGCSSGSNVAKEIAESILAAKEWRERIIAAAQKVEASTSRGNMPGWLTDFITHFTKPTVTWKDYVRRSALATFRGRYSWHRPSRRSEAIGMRLQARKPTPRGAVVLIDSSGSISDRMLSQFLSECVGILRSCNAPWIYLYFHDVDVYFKDKFSIQALKKIRVQRGGTSHIPVFEEIRNDKQEAGLIISFTDLMSEFPAEGDRPTCPMIWAVPKQYENHEHPWGQKVVVDIDDENQSLSGSLSLQDRFIRAWSTIFWSNRKGSTRSYRAATGGPSFRTKPYQAPTQARTSMKNIDREWFININEIYHICKGKEDSPIQTGIKARAGMWIVKDGKCTICDKPVPDHVKIYIS